MAPADGQPSPPHGGLWPAPKRPTSSQAGWGVRSRGQGRGGRVRASKDQLDVLVQSGDHATAGAELAAAASTLEAALVATNPEQPPAAQL